MWWFILCQNEVVYIKNIEEKGVPKLIPEEYRIKHSASSYSNNSSRNGGSANTTSNFYCWEAFGGVVYYVCCNRSNPSISLYVNGSLKKTVSPSAAISGKLVYEAYFDGLSYGDKYYIKEDDGSSIDVRTYIGGRGSAPTLSQTSTEITASMSSPYNKSYSMALGVITFNSDYGSLNSYSREARTRLFESCLQKTEQHAVLGKVSNDTSISFDQYDAVNDTWTKPSCFTREAQITRFDNSTIKVGITSSASTQYYSYFSDYVDDWISDINKLTGRIQFVRDDSISETDNGIRITIGSHKSLFGYVPENIDGEVQIYYGQWEQTRWYSNTGEGYHYEVKLCNELRGAMDTATSFKNITYEELTECLGCGNDMFRRYDSMFSEIWYIGKTNTLLNGNTPTIDGEVVKILYNELDVGDLASELVHKLTPSAACVIQLPCGKYGNRKNKNYSLKTYAMNRKVTWHTNSSLNDGITYWWWDDSDNSYSDIESSISVTPSANTPYKAPTVKSRGSTYFYIDVGDSTQNYDIKLVNGSTESIFSNETPNYDWVYINGLTPTTSYQIYDRISGGTDWFGGFTATTTPAAPQLTVSQKNNVLSISVSPPLTGKYTYITFEVDYTYNGSTKETTVEKATIGNTYTYQADEGTKYSVYAYATYVINGTKLSGDWTSKNGTVQTITRPNDWEWTTTISSSAYVPIDSLGFHPVTATEWNNFTSRINAFREYAANKGISVSGNTNYSFTSVSRGKIFTPAIYNQAVNAIKGISGYGSYLSTISSGTKLTANLFILLKTELNSIQ